MAQVESRLRATSSEEARQRVVEAVENEGVEYVLLWFTDIEGHLKSFAITTSELRGALDDGMGFDGSSITGFNAIEESDMVAIPDPETFVVMPSREGEATVAPDDLRRRHARRRTRTTAIRATSCASRSSACRRWASTPSTSAPSSSTSSSRTTARRRPSTRAATSP